MSDLKQAETIEAASARYAAERAARWHTVDGRQERMLRLFRSLNGRPYRLVMRATHWVGFCCPRSLPVEPGRVWCDWCGMRGKR